MPASADAVWAWHARPGALERLTPPWDDVRVVERTGGLEDGSRVTLSVPLGLMRVTWVSRHRDCVPGRHFVDEQIRGPFVRWVHTHVMVPDGQRSSWLEDHIEYAAPAGRPGAVVGRWLTDSRLAAMFRYRHDLLRGDLAVHARHETAPRLTVAITGASGLIGRALAAFLATGGHRVIRLVRHATRESDAARWDPASGLVDPLPALDAVIHLAGASIAGGRWNETRKAAIRQSRVTGTRSLAESLARLPTPPAALLVSSAIGYYGPGPGPFTEDSGAGTGFLADVCQEWEAAARPAEAAGIRVAHLRTGLVLSPAGGLLRVILPLFKAGLGGRVGSGRQAMSWIGLDDVVDAFSHVLQSTLRGPVNVTSPQAVTNADFTRTLGRVLRRPAFIPAPAFGVRLALGREMADETALAGPQVLPSRLASDGFTFRAPTLEGALRHSLGRPLD